MAIKVVISDPGHTECSKGVGCGEGGGRLALLDYIYSKLTLPRNNHPNHFGKRCFFWNKYTVMSNGFKQRPYF